MKIKNIKNRIICIALALTMVCQNPVLVKADTKSTKVNITEAAQNLTFTIEFDRAGEYEAVLTSPDGTTYDYTAVDNDTMSVDVSKVGVGEWNTKVESNGTIGKYTLSVKGQKATATTNLDKAITVGKDIVGLSLYFKDKNLCASWSDTNIGTIVVKVVNLDNSEVITEENVNDTSFICEIPESVKNISVSVVPSTSKNVEGAAQTFTFEVPSKPDVEITYDVEDITNHTTATAHLVTTANYGFYVENNDNKVYSSEVSAPGTYDVTVDIENEGENNILFYLVDENGNMYSYDKTIIRDTTAPQLSLTKEYDQLTTKEETVDITGTVEDYNSLKINDEVITPTSDGTFEYMASLHVGENKLNILASDNAGNETGYDVTIIRVEDKGLSSLDIFKIVILIAAILFIVSFSIIWKKKKSNKVAEMEIETVQLNKNSNEEIKEEIEEDVNDNENVSFLEGIKTFIIYNKNFVIKSLVFLCIWFYIFVIAFGFNYATSGSMEPTIMIHDIAVVSKLSYVARQPQRGDIVSLKRNNTMYGKRVIGIAGDKIEFHDGYTYINGELFDESAYLCEDVETNCLSTFEVPEGCVFVMGDNRENSNDSRMWDNPYVKISDIKGKHILIIPLHKIF